MIYFDNAATTAPLKEVCEVMNRINFEIYGNTASLHSFGVEAEKLVNITRNKIAEFIGVDKNTITFTSGGTESNNLAILGYLSANPRLGKHLITSVAEHPSVLEVFKYLSSDKSPIKYTTTFIGVDKDGQLDYEQLYSSICEETALISIMSVNNETGAMTDHLRIAAVRNMKNPKTVIHSDCVQSFGKIKLNPDYLGIDMFSASGHKLHGPKGTGFLYVRKGLRLSPILYGGGHEKSLRSGTLNSPAIGALSVAIDNCKENLEKNSRQYVKNIKSELVSRLDIRNNEFFINGNEEEDSPYILNMSFGNVKSEVLLHHLAQRQIYVSSGSACSSNSRKNSHVLTAMGLENGRIDSAVRFSFSAKNTCEEAVEVANVIKEIIPIISYVRHIRQKRS